MYIVEFVIKLGQGKPDFMYNRNFFYREETINN